MPLNLIHNRLANTVILYLVALVIWALWKFFRRERMSPNFRGALMISMLLIIVQALLGGILWLTNHRPETGMHWIYGLIGVLGVPAIYSFTRGRQNRYEMLVTGAGLLLLVVIIFRSVATG